MSQFKLKPSQIKTEVINCFQSGVVPFVQSSPGLGKSAIMRMIAEHYNLELIDVRLSQCAPEDLMGLPMKIEVNGKIMATFAAFEMFPTEDTPLPAGKDGWLLFFDELNSASKSVQAASYKPLLDHMMGMYRLHPQLRIAAAGNLDTDNAIVNTMSTATQSRMAHFEMAFDFDEFITFAEADDWDSRIIGFLYFMPGLAHKFDPDHQDRTFPCPRTWEFASNMIKGTKSEDIPPYRLAAVVGDGAAVEAYSFLKEFSKLPSYGDIVSDPTGTPVPQNPATKYALISMLLEKGMNEDFFQVTPYVERMDPEFQAVFIRGTVRRFPALRRDPDFTRNSRKLMRHILNDPSFADNTVAA